MMHFFKEKLASALSPMVAVDATTLQDWIEIPPDKQLGDLAFPCFQLAKSMRKSPQAIASELAPKLDTEPFISKSEAVGPYVNVHLNRKEAVSYWITQMQENLDFFTSNGGQNQAVAIDLSSPNIAKPFSMGHLRSTIIGTALANLLESDGYQVFRINHLGDWGTQFGKIIVAYHRYGEVEAIKKHPIQELNALYVRFHEEAETNPALEDEGRAAFKRLEDGDEATLDLWRWMVSVSMEEFNRTYAMLGTRFTHVLGESFYNDKMDSVVKELSEKHLLTTSEGAEVVMLEEENLPPCLIRKSDGATLYATRDLAAALYRYRDLGATSLWYVVGGEQRLHFQQLFAVLTRMGYSFAKDCRHIAFGLMKIGGKKMSTRKGQIVRLQEVLDEAVRRAREIIDEKNPGLKSADATAKAIGVGAVIFNDLKTHRIHEINFSLEQAVAFEGETGPYVQYTHARACSLLRKAGLLTGNESTNEWVTFTLNSSIDIAEIAAYEWDDVTYELVKTLSYYSSVRQRAIDDSDPSQIAKFVLDAAQAFNRFYHDVPILSASDQDRRLRLVLVDATRITILRALKILGLECPVEI